MSRDAQNVCAVTIVGTVLKHLPGTSMNKILVANCMCTVKVKHCKERLHWQTVSQCGSVCRELKENDLLVASIGAGTNSFDLTDFRLNLYIVFSLFASNSTLSAEPFKVHSQGITIQLTDKNQFCILFNLWSGFQLSVERNFAFASVLLYCAISGWLAKFAPFSQPIESQTKPIVACPCSFSRAWRRCRVFPSNFDRFITLLAYVVFSHDKYFGFGLTAQFKTSLMG